MDRLGSILLLWMLLAMAVGATVKGSRVGSVASGVTGQPIPTPTPAPGAFVAPPGDLTYPVARDAGWVPGAEKDRTGWTVYDVSNATDMTNLGGCSVWDPAVGATGADQATMDCALNALGETDCLSVPAGDYEAAGWWGDSSVCMIGTGLPRLNFSRTQTSLTPETSLGGVKWLVAKQFWPADLGTHQGAAAGATSITTNFDPTVALAVGERIRLVSDAPATYQEASFQVCTECRYGEYVLISGLTSNSISFTATPLKHQLLATGTKVMDADVNAPKHAIFHGFSWQQDGTPGSASTPFFDTRYVHHAEFVGNTFGEHESSALFVKETMESCLIRGNTFGDQSRTLQWQKSTVNLGANAQGCVVEDNTFNGSEVAIEVQVGAVFNVVAYNRIHDANTFITDSAPPRIMCDRGIFLHGNGTRSTLVEGNYTECTIQNDQFWGNEGENNIFHANRAIVPATKGDPGFTAEDILDPDPRTLNSIDNTWLVNSGDSMVRWGDGGVFDSESTGVWLERNLMSSTLSVLPEPTTTQVSNVAGANTMDCTGVAIPTSFYLTEQPAWWTGGAGLCDFGKGEGEGIGACGDDLGGTLCEIPAGF